ncbi:MAG: DUF899 domain-containing protein [Balneolaceae bacterium]
MKTQKSNRPKIISKEKWLEEYSAFLEKEKEFTRQRDQLNAERRKLSMVEVQKEYEFEGTEGKESLIDLFEGRRQLIVYHHMLKPADKSPCSGCSMVVDNIGHLAHLHARDTTLVLVSRAPVDEIEAFKKRMGWDIPWFSVAESDFNPDFGITSGFGVNVFLKDHKKIFHTYFTTGRGVEYLGSNWSYLDLTPFGRQELWEDSPEGYPQTKPYEWWRLHDEYD